MDIKLLNKLSSYMQSQPIEKAWIFGSYAREEQTAESDIDIMVKFIPNIKIGLIKYFEIKSDLENISGKEVDLIPEDSIFPFAKGTALTDRELIYERKTV